ncbi:helix-turn-helix domain-containing protein [Bacteroides sp.]|uniref:helix-turn-helix domain-containing protein n=1 Tax=Bacteroides sp. TaxID=29523 RepID=UPI002FC74AEE
MSIEDIIHSGANVSITVCADDLIQFANHLVKTTREELEAVISSKNEEAYKTPAEASEILHVDKSTLWRWAKIGYLIPIEVGGKRLYKQSDINAILRKN